MRRADLKPLWNHLFRHRHRWFILPAMSLDELYIMHAVRYCPRCGEVRILE